MMKVNVRRLSPWVALNLILATVMAALLGRAEISPPDRAQSVHPAVPVASRSSSTNGRLPAVPMRTNWVALTPARDDAVIAKVTATLLTQFHYRRMALGDEVASQFLDQYLDALDPAHLLFIRSDLDEFEAYRKVLDELTSTGDTSPADKIFNRFMIRIDQQAAFVDAFLKTNRFDFKTDENYPLSRKTAPRPRDLPEARKLWGDRVRFEYLQEKLNDKKHDEIVEIITRRYTRQQRFLKEWDDSDVLPIYLTALAHVYDPHSDYMGGPQMENFNIDMKLSLFGIGALLQSEDGYCMIRELTPGGPAEKSGKLKPNDKIIAVAQGDREPVDVVDMKLNKVVELIRGPKDTKVRLTIIPAHASDPSMRQTVVLIRDEIKLEAREAKAKIIERGLGVNEKRLGIIDLPSFYSEIPVASAARTNELKSTTADVARLLKKLLQEKVDGVILDLRRNGGGSLEEAIRLTGLFITKGPVVQVQDPDGTITVDDDPDPSVAYDGPLVVLTSRFSASASEILAGALQDYGRALIVGDKATHGKGTVQQLIQLENITKRVRPPLASNPGALKITIRKFYLPNGASTQQKGVIPDIILPSVNNVADIGESSLPNALKYDTIASAKFQPVNRVEPFLAELRKRSGERVAQDKDFSFIRTEIERYKKTQDEKSVSLNEQQRRKEKEEAAALLKARKLELAGRGDDGEKVYDLTLKQVDLPGLPPPTPKTNLLHLALANRITSSGASGSNSVASVPTVVPKDNSKSSDADPGDEETKGDADSMPFVDSALDETERILNDLISLSTGKNGAEQTTALAE